MLTYQQLGRNGRLGNQLWQIAGTIGIARQRDETAGFPFWRYMPYFRVPDEYFPGPAILDGADLGLEYFQDLRHLEAVEDDARIWFSPTQSVLERLQRRYKNFLQLPHKTAVHVRRGDYLQFPGKFVALPLDYYNEAMQIMGPPHAIFSDDLGWCKEHFPKDCLFMEHNRDYEDLFLMSFCDQHITSNSTFSWWSAWLSRGKAVYPHRWFGPEHYDLMIRMGVRPIDPAQVIPHDGIVI